MCPCHQGRGIPTSVTFIFDTLLLDTDITAHTCRYIALYSADDDPMIQ